MRVWVYPEKTYEELGAVRWVAETELVKKASLGKEECDPDVDIEYVGASRKTYEAAKLAAEKMLRHDRIAYGAVRVQKQVVDWFVEEDRVAEWADVGDAEEFSTDDFQGPTSA